MKLCRLALLRPAGEASDREKRKFIDRDTDFGEDDLKEWKRRWEAAKSRRFECMLARTGRRSVRGSKRRMRPTGWRRRMRLRL